MESTGLIDGPVSATTGLQNVSDLMILYSPQGQALVWKSDGCTNILYFNGARLSLRTAGDVLVPARVFRGKSGRVVIESRLSIGVTRSTRLSPKRAMVCNIWPGSRISGLPAVRFVSERDDTCLCTVSLVERTYTQSQTVPVGCRASCGEDGSFRAVADIQPAGVVRRVIAAPPFWRTTLHQVLDGEFSVDSISYQPNGEFSVNPVEMLVGGSIPSRALSSSQVDTIGSGMWRSPCRIVISGSGVSGAAIIFTILVDVYPAPRQRLEFDVQPGWVL